MNNNESAIYNMDEKHPDWELLAALDESESYEVDITEVWKTPAGYSIVTATGCSCWGGEFDSDEHATLDAVIEALRTGEQPRYNPSTKGAEELIAQLQALA